MDDEDLVTYYRAILTPLMLSRNPQVMLSLPQWFLDIGESLYLYHKEQWFIVARDVLEFGHDRIYRILVESIGEDAFYVVELSSFSTVHFIWTPRMLLTLARKVLYQNLVRLVTTFVDEDVSD